MPKYKNQKEKDERLISMIKEHGSEELIEKVLYGKVPKTYKYPLDDLNVATLLKIWHSVIENGSNDINVANIGLLQSERLRMTQLRFHGLIAKVMTEGNTHKANSWLITRNGSDFIHGRIAVHQHVITRDNKVVGHSEEMITKNDFSILGEYKTSYEILGAKVEIIVNNQRAFNL